MLSIVVTAADRTEAFDEVAGKVPRCAEQETSRGHFGVLTTLRLEDLSDPGVSSLGTSASQVGCYPA